MGVVKEPPGMRVGELAHRTGVSVRTLHYYDQIGLLSPSQHSAAGHRRYRDGAIVRLQQIRSLQQLGLSLEQVRGCLDRAGFSPLGVIELHLARLREQIEAQRRLLGRLEALAAGLRSVGDLPVEQFIRAIEEMKMVEKYYTPEQLEQIKEQGRKIGEARIREVEAEWPVLMEQVRAEMGAGTDPGDERVQALARRWMGLVREFTGGDPGIERSLGSMCQREETIHGRDVAPMRQMFEFISQALAVHPNE